ncbi:MAG: hypothetical protein AAF490_20605 [Chloroflexota bacterium]
MKTVYFNEIHQRLIEASSASDIFGNLSKISGDALKRCFRQLAQQVHPDHHPNFKKEANDAFLKLQFWYSQALIELRTSQGGLKFESGQNVYVTTAVSAPGDIADIWQAETGSKKVILKIVRQPKNNDLMLAESSWLKHLKNDLKGDPLLAHFPTLIESFKVKDASGAERAINVLENENEFVTLAEVIQAHPQGIHPADAAWMFNRLLAALAKTHQLGWVHGAVIPPHLLLNLNDHNGKLIDWCYSQPIGEKVKAISPSYKPFYPMEVLEKRPSTPATDIYLAGMTLLKLLGGDVATKTVPTSVPKPIGAFLKACLIGSPHRRPQNSWALFDDFQEILQRLYGAPKFRPFSL